MMTIRICKNRKHEMKRFCETQRRLFSKPFSEKQITHGAGRFYMDA